MCNNLVRSHVKFHGFNCFTLIFLQSAAQWVWTHTNQNRKKGVCTESSETEMHGTHSFIQQLKGDSMSSIAIYHINKDDDSSGSWNKMFNNEMVRKPFNDSCVCLWLLCLQLLCGFLTRMDVFFVKKRSCVKPQMLRLRPKDEKMSSSQSILILKKWFWVQWLRNKFPLV